MRYNLDIMKERAFQRRNSVTKNFPSWYIPNPTLPTHPKITEDTNKDVQRALLLSIVEGSRRLDADEFAVCFKENFPRLNPEFKEYALADITDDKQSIAQSIIEEITAETTDTNSEISNIS